MKKQVLFLLFIFCSIAAHAQTNVIWEKVNSVSAKKTGNVSGKDKLYYKLNENLFTQKIAASGKTSKSAASEITIPNAEGVLERFMVWESSNFDPELQAKYPEIRAYIGTGLDDKTAKIHFSVAPIGVQTMVLRSGKTSEFIEQNPENKSEYVLFTSKNTDTSKSLICKTKDESKNISNKTAKTASNTKTLKTLRLAISCTGEYTTFFGGTKAGALAGMNATMTRVNAIFNKDLAVQLKLIANNEDVIYINAATDPYSNAQVGVNGAWNLEVQQTLTTVIGNSGYDIGHLFGRSGGGGDAGCIGCVCDNPVSATDEQAKGSAFTSPSDGIPQGATFDIDYVAHEIGHQLGATHTFSYETEGTGTNVEPGSGSTIMGYAGLTDYDVQNHSDDYFAYASILQIQNNLATKSCPVSTAILNNPPTINAGSDYTIPINTPFVLTGTGSDSDGDAVTFCWEQNDNATSTTKDKSIAYPSKPDGPLFRSLPPIASPVRYMPSLNTVLQNRLTTTWESVSSIPRSLHFSLTGRDNSVLDTPQTNTGNMIVTVSSVGPFVVTSQNTTDIGWQKGSFQPITWNVNNTNTLQGSANVNIKLSTDGGLTFPIILASNTPNDGSEIITVPSDVAATNCRILIEPTANIYYALNTDSFAIGYSSTTTCNTYSFGSAFSIPFSSSGSFTTKTVAVPASTGTVSDVNVAVNVTHDRFSDIEIQIASPQGTVVKLYDKDCDIISSTLILGYDDSGVALDCSKTTSQIVLPIESLSAFNGQNPQGIWTFRVRDAVSGGFGTINSASINICTKTFTLDNSEFEKIDFVLYPNPNKGNFTVQFDCDSTKVVEVEVHNILGEKVYARTFDKAPYFYQNIQMQNTTAGLYLVTVTNGDRRIVKKIIVN